MHATGGVEGTNRLLSIAGMGRTSTVLRRYGATIGEGDRILSPLIVHNAEPDYRNLTVGRDCYIGRDVLLDLTEPISLGDGVTVSMRTTIVTHMDVGRSPLREFYPSRSGSVRIGYGAYIGAGVIVLGGVEIGANSVVAAGAVVTRDVPEMTMVAGVPARVVKSVRPAEPRTAPEEPTS